jgi:2-C-methyl-D-erythritol 4-phosphate cytidylyltransferase/2-C-methyl-D-erythritol 2,4-cyclodiphosphate synthase
VERLVVVIDSDDHDLAGQALSGLNAQLVDGAAERTGSVRAGLEALAAGPRPEAVLIHDAARPGLSAAIVGRLLQALEDADGAAPALPTPDALKRVVDGWVSEDVARADLRRVQTPQAFRFDLIAEAFAALPADVAFEDDIAVARRADLRVRLIDGDARLAKVTMPEDFAALEQALAPAVPLIGNGFDAHRFGSGEFVTLCGLRIPHTQGLIGHSDADAAWHALTDAILGGIGQGDIGEHFPPTDVRWKGAASEVFLRHAHDLAKAAGARLVNVDMTLMCEAPKIRPHREAMRERTAAVLGLPLARVSVKATTTEGLGFLGRREGLAAQACALLMGPA